MIRPRTPPPSAADVARHYGDLDHYYREIWGEHVHHGLWERGDETADAAVEALVRKVADAACIDAGAQVCDVGSGYGATARLLAREREARVTAMTLSPAQHRTARTAPWPDGAGPAPRYLLGDWLGNELPDASFDAVIAVESTEHMADLQGALAQVRRVLRPGGRFVACVWLARENPTRAERRWLLEPICREGRLARLTDAPEFMGALAAAGLDPAGFSDLSRQVRRTWTLCVGRALRRLASDPQARRFLLDRRQPERVFARTLGRIWLAYRTGSLRYGLFTAVRPGAPAG